ncbi:MAG: hypothetical protein WC362_00165 [Methanoregula sp.]|jgi:hypothetical protein
MNELLLFMLGIAGVFSVPCSGALLLLGKMIDQYPTEYEEQRARSLSSPVASTRLAVILFWALFLCGAWAVTQGGGRLILIAGITTIFAICLFLFTAIVFSVAVLSALRRQRAVLLRVEKEVALETALIHLEKTTGVKVPSPVVPETKPIRRLPTSAFEALLRQY